MAEFTPHQDAALKAVAGWLKEKPGRKGTPQVFRLFGFAGTGKTTLARHIAAGVDGKVLFKEGSSMIWSALGNDPIPQHSAKLPTRRRSQVRSALRPSLGSKLQKLPSVRAVPHRSPQDSTPTLSLADSG